MTKLTLEEKHYFDSVGLFDFELEQAYYNNFIQKMNKILEIMTYNERQFASLDAKIRKEASTWVILRVKYINWLEYWKPTHHNQ